jgi:transcription elongation factor Elf1
MSDIRSKPYTKQYGDNWNKIFGCHVCNTNKAIGSFYVDAMNEMVQMCADCAVNEGFEVPASTSNGN